MSKPLTIVAILQALPGFENDVANTLKDCISPTLAEAGCLQYDLHTDNNKPGLFLFFENWSTRDHWLVHMESDHLAAMKKATEGKMQAPVIHEMEKVGS